MKLVLLKHIIFHTQKKISYNSTPISEIKSHNLVASFLCISGDNLPLGYLADPTLWSNEKGENKNMHMLIVHIYNA